MFNYNMFQREIGGQDYTDGSSISYVINFHFSICPIRPSASEVSLADIVLVLALNIPACHHLNMQFMRKYCIFQDLSFKYIFI